MKIYITGLPSGYEVEHLVRLFYPMAPLTLTPPENAEDCVWAEKTPDGLHALVRQDGRSAERHAPLPAPVEQGGETPEFSLASLTYDLLRDWTGIRPPWGKMTGVRPVRLIHDKRAAGWTEAEIDHFFLDRFDCSQQKYQMAKAIADLQEPILKVGNEPGTYSLYIGIPFCPSRCSYCSFVSCNLDRDRKMVQPYVDCLCREVEEIRIQADKAGLKLCSIYIGGGTPSLLAPGEIGRILETLRRTFRIADDAEITMEANPDSLSYDKAAALADCGVNRLSLGVQSFSDAMLAFLGRVHTAAQGERAIQAAYDAGIHNLSLDLMYGLPGQTLADVRRDVERLSQLPVVHASIYSLIVEEGTQLKAGLEKGGWAAAPRRGDGSHGPDGPRRHAPLWFSSLRDFQLCQRPLRVAPQQQVLDL